MKPRSVNFQVNDICNARCVMCNVWQHKRDREMSPAEFAALLADPFFSEVEHVGITGGEPTLRRDLPEFYLALPDVCPRLTGASFITHGFDTGRAVSMYRRVAEHYRGRRLEFHGMVSLDGLGPVHDRVRGRTGAFERATATLFGLKASGIPTSACCTIVRSNVWHVQDLLEWGYDKTYIRFRVAEFINRLENGGAAHEIRAFDAAERSSLISFFTNLILHYEPDEMVRRTYASIVTMLSGGARSITCPYQDGRAINLDCRGAFAICAPKGRPHPLAPDPIESVRAAGDERASIVATHCAGCIHDYHDDWRPDVAEQRARAVVIRSHLALRPAAQPLVPAADPKRPHAKVLVIGWYGTETIGDMAILCAIVDRYRASSPGARFIVLSEYPDYTRHNLSRLGLDCRVIDYGDPALTGDLHGADTVVFGGGPLMDIPQLTLLASIFERARHLGCRTIVESCGVGPVHLPETADAIRRLAAASTDIRVRDRASADLLARLAVASGVSRTPQGLRVASGFSRTPPGLRAIEITEDPAAAWVRSTGVRHTGTPDPVINVFARELTHEYPQQTTPAEATAAVAALVQRLADAYPDRTVTLNAMHHFPVGGDDRIYARRLAALVDRTRCIVDAVPRTPLETLQIMAHSSLVVCMRFHSLVFAHGIGAPLLAIDYTDGGKVAGYVREHGLDERVLTFERMAAFQPGSAPVPVPVPGR